MKEPLENFDYSAEPEYKGISRNTARALAFNYQRECQLRLSGQATNQPAPLDARSLLIPIETLKKYIWEIEHQVRDSGAQNELAIRMYYGKYPDLKKVKANPQDRLFKDLQNLPDAYSFLQTLFLVPAFKSEDGIFRDFDPFQIHGSALEQMDATESGADDGNSMSAIMNHGNLTPPPFTMDEHEQKQNGLSF